jgi:hypothetical protein
MTHRYKTQDQDKQPAMSGKSGNDTNKLGKAQATQKNEGRRTPTSRHDRENLIGNNQTHMRQGGPNQGEKNGVRASRPRTGG